MFVERALRSACVAVASFATACQTDTSRHLPTFDTSAMRIASAPPPTVLPDGRVQDAILEVGGPWARAHEAWTPATKAMPVSGDEESLEDPETARRQRGLAQLLARKERSSHAIGQQLPAPGPARQSNRAESRTLAERTRAYVLDNPTHIRAASITFYCPPAYRSEFKLAGDSVGSPHPDRQAARGRARLTCRSLLLEAERITVRELDDADADLHITASGNVHLALRIKDQVHREEGIEGLLVTNDNVVPLR